MTGVRFVRFYPSDWRSGCIGMTMEQEGLYIRICAFIYETDRRLPKDPLIAAKFMGVHPNAYRKIHAQLCALGKLTEHDDGWSVVRVERELAAARGAIGSTDTSGIGNRQADQVEGRQDCEDTLGDTTPVTPLDTPLDTPHNTGGVFSKSVNEISTALIEPVTNNQNHKKKPRKPLKGASPSDCLTAFEGWNDLALRSGLAQANFMTPKRQRSIGARLREAGADGWCKALSHIEQSAFLTGQNDRGWRITLDWMVKPDNFAKLVDGAYGNGRHAEPKKSAWQILKEMEAADVQ